MSIRDWPIHERPREKLIERGAQVLSEAELLAVLLGSGLRGRSAVEFARDLLIEFGSLRGLFTSGRIRFLKQKGLGPTRYCVLQAALELGRRCADRLYQSLCTHRAGYRLNNPRAVRAADRLHRGIDEQ